MSSVAIRCAAVGALAMLPATAFAQTDEKPDRAWTLAADYIGDVAGVADGGAARGARYLDNIDVALDADLDKAFGWHKANAHVSLLNNMGGNPNDLAGSIQGINNIEVNQPRLKLYEAWVEKGLGAGVTVRAGLYDVNSEFYQNESAGLLISPMFGVGSELAATGVNGPAIFPSTALAARFKVETTRAYAAFAVVNARAGTIGDRQGIDFSGRDGALLLGELGWTGSGRVAVGAWRYTRTQPRIEPADISQAPGYAISSGIYLLAEHDLRGTADGVRHLTGFVRAGLSEGRTTPFRGGWQAGLLLQRVFAARPASQLSIGAGSGLLSRAYRAASPTDLPPLGAEETILEATYSDDLIKGVSLQPDVQYVIHPSADPTLRNALVLGLRLTLSWASR